LPKRRLQGFEQPLLFLLCRLFLRADFFACACAPASSPFSPDASKSSLLVCPRRLLHLLLFLRKLGRLERLPIKSNLRDADRRIVLPVSAQLLVLLLALVVEDQDLSRRVPARPPRRSPALPIPRAQRCPPRPKPPARRRTRPSVLVFLRFHPDHVARSDTILLSTCADHRVHRLSLCSSSKLVSRPTIDPVGVGTAALGCQNRAAARHIPKVCLLLFPQVRLLTGNAARPQNGPIPQVQANSVPASLSCAVEIGQTRPAMRTFSTKCS
jgi:hypothetical protein